MIWDRIGFLCLAGLLLVGAYLPALDKPRSFPLSYSDYPDMQIERKICVIPDMRQNMYWHFSLSLFPRGLVTAGHSLDTPGVVNLN